MLIHKLIGKLVSSRIGFSLIKSYAFRTPHAHIHDQDGSLYMGRWRIVDEGTLGGKILHALTGFKSIRLHHICRPDHDRDLHNHPFSYRTFILRGWYSEEFKDGVQIAYRSPDGFFRIPKSMGGVTLTPFSTWLHQGMRFIRSGETAVGARDKFHRITTLSDGGVWTLFCMTENHDKWGFHVDHKFVDSTRYLLRNGYPKESIRGVQER